MLAHELSHVAHRDVLVMTVAPRRGHRRRHAHPRRAVRRSRLRRPRDTTTTAALPVWLVVLLVSLVVYAVSFLLLRLLSRYRELCADRAGRLPDHEARRAGLGAAEDHRRDRPRSRRATCAQVRPMNAFFIAPAISGVSPQDADLDPPVAGAAARAARPDPGRARPAVDLSSARARGALGDDHRAEPAEARQPRRAVPRAERRDHAADRGRADAHRRGSVCYRAAEGAAFHADPGRRRGAARRRRRRPEVETSTDEFGFTWLLVHRRPGRHVGRAVHRPARGQHHAGERGLRPRAAVLAGPVRRPVGPPGRPGLPLQAGHVLPVRARPARSGATTCSRSAGPRPRCRAELPIEPDLSGWMALWGAPGL